MLTIISKDTVTAMSDEEILARMQQSDHILCTNIGNLHFSAKRRDDAPFMHAFGRSLPSQIRNVESELQLWANTFTSRFDIRTPMIVNRGQTTPRAPHVTMPMQHIQYSYVTPTAAGGQYQLYNNISKRR